MRAAVLGSATFVAGLLMLSDTPTADACGCLSPPQPPPNVAEAFAVNQQAEQIIFEVEPGWVTAHVLIKYAGDPASFAWIVPVPEIPELGVSPVSAFGLLDKSTAPDVSTNIEDICPVSEWTCAYHEQPSCGFSFGAGADQGGVALSDAGASSDAGSTGVTVISEQVVGDYQTVTFRADEAGAATQWLRDNNFIVNQTTSIYMESYVQQNFVFVAAKLVPGAGIKAIKPLKLRYRAAYPMVPLILTAVAAEPNLTVTSFVYGDYLYRPLGHPVVTIDAKRIAKDSKGRDNYPMVLARTIDEAGGDGFVLEYQGYPIYPDVNQNSQCCSSGFDQCGLGFNGSCECPMAEFDRTDCEATSGDLLDGVALLEELAQKHGTLTRITTRISAEEMTFDPAFEPDFDGLRSGRLFLRGSQASLGACAGAVMDTAAFIDADAKQSCAATYCGTGGSCAVTNSGAACACEPTYVAQRFLDLDGSSSITCVPATPPVDLRANGEQLPDACAGVSCGAGTCIDRNGVAVCDCNDGAAAVPGATIPRCEAIVFATTTPGGEDYSEPLRALDVCAPPPPTCGEGGWLHKIGSSNPGVDCGGTTPPAHLTRPGVKPTCDGWFGCGCSSPGAPPTSMVVVFGMVGMILLRRRPRGRGR